MCQVMSDFNNECMYTYAKIVVQADDFLKHVPKHHARILRKFHQNPTLTYQRTYTDTWG